MPCVIAPDPPIPPGACEAPARVRLMLAPLAMALAGLTTVDVGQAPVVRKGSSRVATSAHSAECIVAQAVFAGAQPNAPVPQSVD